MLRAPRSRSTSAPPQAGEAAGTYLRPTPLCGLRPEWAGLPRRPDGHLAGAHNSAHSALVGIRLPVRSAHFAPTSVPQQRTSSAPRSERTCAQSQRAARRRSPAKAKRARMAPLASSPAEYCDYGYRRGGKQARPRRSLRRKFRPLRFPGLTLPEGSFRIPTGDGLRRHRRATAAPSPRRRGTLA